MTQTQTPYRVKGVFLETCNCDSGCNCNFGGFPDHGSCEALIGIKIDEGKIGDVDLSGMKVVLAVKWPKAIHEGDGAAAIYIDESASEEQVGGMATILTGQAGGARDGSGQVGRAGVVWGGGSPSVGHARALMTWVPARFGVQPNARSGSGSSALMTGKAPPFGGNSKTWSSVKRSIASTSFWKRVQRIIRSSPVKAYICA